MFVHSKLFFICGLMFIYFICSERVFFLLSRVTGDFLVCPCSYHMFWPYLALFVVKGHSGLGARGGRRVWREYGSFWRQQLQSFRNPPKLPTNLQSPVLIQGANQPHTQSSHTFTYHLFNHNAQYQTQSHASRVSVIGSVNLPLITRTF